jgi:ubiquitin carboxyl-terminal hydrolase 2/21
MQTLYELFAVDIHSGSMSFGHYTAYVKHPVTGKWHDCNGAYIRMMSDFSGPEQRCYLLPKCRE